MWPSGALACVGRTIELHHFCCGETGKRQDSVAVRELWVVQAQSTYVYIFFGTALRFLQDAVNGVEVHGEGRILGNIDEFLRTLDEFGLIVTERAACQLRELREELVNQPEEHTLSPDEATRLRNIMDTLRPTLFAEASGKVAFIVSDKRVDVNKLLGNISALLSPNVYEALPEIARYDFDEAGKYIAFERPTAAAFHLLRGTESVLRDYSCSVVKSNRVKTLLWGPMVNHLRDRKKNPPPKGLLSNLDNIRVHLRNPTAHPEKIYDIDEVQDLFGLSVEIVNRMVKSKP